MQSGDIIWILASLLGSFLIYLVLEMITHNKRLNSIPVTISISGTRGKTSVGRMLYSVLRENGKTVLCKTTGTEAKYILPDGTEEKIKRFGTANILEQKSLIKKAAKLKVDILISEIMSIQPENHHIETGKLLKPNYTIITNLFPDHLDAAPDGEMGKVYANDIYPGSTLIIPNDIKDKYIDDAIARGTVNCIRLKCQPGRSTNIALVKGLASELGCSKADIDFGIANFSMDMGETRAYKFIKEGKEVIFFSSFAVNDPVSAKLIINEIINTDRYRDFNISLMLNTREDRPERSIQWLKEIKKGLHENLDTIFLTGSHKSVLSKKVAGSIKIKHREPHLATSFIIDSAKKNTLVFGMGNILGAGKSLIDYWKKNGQDSVIK